jgi:hypothetical protein
MLAYIINNNYFWDCLNLNNILMIIIIIKLSTIAHLFSCCEEKLKHMEVLNINRKDYSTKFISFRCCIKFQFS